MISFIHSRLSDTVALGTIANSFEGGPQKVPRPDYISSNVAIRTAITKCERSTNVVRQVIIDDNFTSLSLYMNSIAQIHGLYHFSIM